MATKQLRDFFSREENDAILAAIRDAEMHTSGEIRVRLDARAGDDVKASARKVFDTLGMRQTALRNGVLFYLSVEDRKFLILADDGIYHKVPLNFWDSITQLVLDHFRRSLYADGLVAGVKLAGEQLANFFPRSSQDVNELPDEISLGDG
jgi:uncharacterized membrane protein